MPTNPIDGQPALDHIRGLLERGIHVVTANKGPVAFGYHELKALAISKGVGFLFESTVMDGAPVFGVGREGLAGSDIHEIRGIFNSTTNYILTRMEQDSLSFEEAVKAAQEIGIAEADPALDIDGWDSAIKTVILANVLMGADLRPPDVAREGIRNITLDEVQAASITGQRIKLVCEAIRQPDGSVSAQVGPRRLPASDLFASITDATSVVDYYSDMIPRLTIIEHNPSPVTTAYGMLVDMINILRSHHMSGAG
jgi:homoserine dehydrogenase